MPSGVIYVLKCHEDSVGVLVFDRLHMGAFSHDVSVVAAFVQVYKDDVQNTPNDAWEVRFFYPSGTDPGTGQSIQDFLDDALIEINLVYGTSGAGLNTPPSGYY